MTRTLAQLEINGTSIDSPLDSNITTLADVINLAISFLFPLAGVILLFILIWGGYDFLLSQGDSDKISSARAKITAGIVGFVLLVISYLLVRILTFIFGLDDGIL
jgi:hypothetical protein